MLLVYVTSLILLFCVKADATITWTAPPPQRGPIAENDNSIRRTIQKLIKDSTDQHLTWNFAISGQTLFRVAWIIEPGNTRIGTKTDSKILVRNHADRFNISTSDPATLIILKVTEASAEIIRCEVETKEGAVWSDEIQVKVGVPAMFNNVSGNRAVLEGSNLQLFCAANGSPTPNVTWNRVSGDGSVGEVLHAWSTLNLVNVNAANAGKYQCTANNGFGKPVTHVLQVTVLIPPKIELQNNYYVGREKSVSLHCQVEGYPPPTITWTPCNPQKNVCDKSRLNISKVQTDADYKCTVNNTLGNLSASTSLIIGSKKIGLTFSITSEEIECDGRDTSFWEELQKAVDNIFTGKKGYDGATLLNTRCGSLIVDLALEFTTVVSEAWVISTLRSGITDGKLGEFPVNASSIVGIPVIESTATPPTGKTTTKPSEDINIALIVGCAVGGFIALVIIIVVVVWCVRKNNNKDKDKKSKSKTGNKEVSDNDAEEQRMSQFQGGRPTPGFGNNGYEDTGSTSRPPAANAGKKVKKGKKKRDDESGKPVGVVYAQVDKSKRTAKPMEPENFYDQATGPNSKRPGELQYASPEDLHQGHSMPRNSTPQAKKPEAYTETQYAVLV